MAGQALKLYAYIVTEKYGEKRILSIGSGDDELPLVATNIEELSKTEFRELARKVSRETGRVVELMTFTKVSVLERYEA